MHNFSKLALELNELEDGVAPTDSRRRPDLRLMENGDWDEANVKKTELEEQQRARKKKLVVVLGSRLRSHSPAWFAKQKDAHNDNKEHHIFKGDYWEKKREQDWSRCPKIFS